MLDRWKPPPRETPKDGRLTELDRDTPEEGRATPPTREPDTLGRRTVPVRADPDPGLARTARLDEGLRGTVRVSTGALPPRLMVAVRGAPDARPTVGARPAVGARPRVGVRVTLGARCTVGALLTVSTRR